MTLHVSYKAFNFVKEDYTPLMQHLKLECYEMRAIAVMPCISETLPMSCVCLVMKQTPTFVLQRKGGAEAYLMGMWLQRLDGCFHAIHTCMYRRRWCGEHMGRPE